MRTGMSLATEIELPDGTILEAPDGVDPSKVAKAYLGKKRQAAPPVSPADEILTMPIEAPYSRPNTPQPTMLQQAGKYAGDYGRGILDAASGVKPGEEVAGALEAAASLGTGMLSPFSSAMATFAQGKSGRDMVDPERFTYQPRTQTGQSLLKLLGAVSKPVTDSGADIALGPLAMEAGNIPRMPRTGPPLAPSSTVGASAAATDLSAVSPELRTAVEAAGRRGNVSNEAIARHVEAESLPVPIRLSAGEATQDPVLLSHERNLRGKHEEMTRRMDESNKALAQNLSQLRERTGEEVFSTNAVDHGDTLISVYRAKDEAARSEINAAYKAARDANGGDLPMNGQGFVSAADAALKKNMKARYVPAEVKADLADIRETGAMNFETFENLRTNLAAEARKAERSGDGNAAGAVRIVRDALEGIEPVGAVAQVKPLFDKARGLARSRFDALDMDPAYKAAIDETVPADRFVQRFVLSAPRDQLGMMMNTIGDIAQARQTVSVAALEHLRDAARLTPNYEGNFSAAGFNKALQALSPKANLIFDADTTETLGKLGNVSRYTTAQPRGSFVNNSNTLVSRLTKPALSTLEGVVNFSMGGIPGGTAARALIEKAGTRRMIDKSLAPGAGVRLTAEQLRRRETAKQLRP